MDPSASETAVRARERGNELYRKGLLSQAIRAYTEASQLDPSDPSPLSNLSAACFEAGNYSECIAFAEKAVDCLSEAQGGDPRVQKLRLRMAKAYIHLSSIEPAAKVLSHVQPGGDKDMLQGALKSLADFSAQSIGLGRTTRIISLLGTILSSLSTAKRSMESAKNDKLLSFMFCGVGDARSLFQTVFTLFMSQVKSKQLHFTILDHKPAIIARDLISFLFD
ncbi:Uu.00g127870.m01.CDS01 [Anthostomella pinea]|uniref:Uu.00g127870.m01.CDS01 n=1 Tax=Anthostomella pinea TaxID=933095 RepID=A0AAI8VI52_9PEZI|nr:Uu.00g127870.m01.CDS01 [Anthostomella pinea]